MVDWTAVGLMSPALPWLAILALLALKPNCGWSTWWIWIPLTVLAAGWHGLEPALQDPGSGLDQNALNLFVDVPIALALGLAALWLLAPYLGRGHRSLAFLGSVLVLSGFSVFSFAATAGWDVGAESIMGLMDPRHCSDTTLTGELALPLFVPLAALAAAVATAMSLSGLACRGRYRPWWLCLWLLLFLSVAWLVASGLLHAWCRMAAPDSMMILSWGTPFIVAILFVTLLPFLILSSINPFFRERLKSLLHLQFDNYNRRGQAVPAPDERHSI